MLFIGTMQWASTRSRGVFFCPICEASQTYRLRAARPFLTIYFIPAIPIGAISEYVQCANCKNSFEPEVLSHRRGPSSSPPETQLNRVSFEDDLSRAMALTMIADGHVTEREIDVAIQFYRRISGMPISREDLGIACSVVQGQALTVPSFLATAAGRRSHQERIHLIQAMFGVAAAEGEISPERMSSLLRAQSVLSVDEAEFQQAVLLAQEWLD